MHAELYQYIEPLSAEHIHFVATNSASSLAEIATSRGPEIFYGGDAYRWISDISHFVHRNKLSSCSEETKQMALQFFSDPKQCNLRQYQSSTNTSMKKCIENKKHNDRFISSLKMFAFSLTILPLLTSVFEPEHREIFAAMAVLIAFSSLSSALYNLASLSVNQRRFTREDRTLILAHDIAEQYHKKIQHAYEKPEDNSELNRLFCLR